MEDKVKEHIEICDELGLTLGRLERKHAILEIMLKENATADEVNEAWAAIKERCERKEAEKKELCSREDTESQEQREEAERHELSS